MPFTMVGTLVCEVYNLEKDIRSIKTDD